MYLMVLTGKEASQRIGERVPEGAWLIEFHKQIDERTTATARLEN